MSQTFGKKELNKHTTDDLKKMQAWSFERKIMVTQTRIQEWYQRFDGKVAINFSGGVDSTVLLDLARCCYHDIPAVFVDTGLEWPEVRETGYVPIVGTLASESRRRRDAWLLTGCNAFDAKKQISKPLSFWKQSDVLHYIHEFNIPYASIYGEIVADKKGVYKTTGAKQTGCSLCPTGCHLDKTNKYKLMKETHPDLWDYGINALGLGDFLDFVGVDYGRECECQSNSTPL
ncbi:hypothetical protein AGMMS49975_13670 [Clostridia bacterium]|nr:hypothetical protein AGMMS49975_13670 [Clostridia bacterium]